MINKKQTVQDYIDSAIELWEEGFTSMASKKRCLEKLNTAYSFLSGGLPTCFPYVPSPCGIIF